MKLGRILGGLAGGFGAMNMGGYLANAMQHRQQGQMPQQMPQTAMPGQMGPVDSPMQPVQMGAPTPPTSFGQRGGMFGGQPQGMGAQGFGDHQAMMERYRQMMMGNYGGGY